MNRKDLFLKAIKGLTGYPGGDPAPENYWTLSDLVEFYESETGETLDLPEYDEEGNWANAVYTAIENNMGLNEDLNRFNRLI